MTADPHRGLAEHDPSAFGRRVLGGWDAFLRLAEAVDLDAHTRLPHWTARDVLVHLGSWPEHAAISGIAEAARSGALPGPAPDPDRGNAAVVVAHRDAARPAVLAALQGSRAAAAAYFAQPDVAELGRRPVATPVGPLPATSAVHAVCYELAVHALDLASAGAPAPDRDLLDAGMAALLDATGSLAARADLAIGVSALDAGGGWRFISRDGGWEVSAVGPETPPPPRPRTAVRGTYPELLDVSAGRANAAALVASRRLQVEDLPAFLRLAPLVEYAPHLPGGAALRGAGRLLRTATGLLGRLRPS